MPPIRASGSSVTPSALGTSVRHGQGQVRGRSSPDSLQPRRRLFMTPDVEEDAEEPVNHTDMDNVACLMKKPGQVGPTPPVSDEKSVDALLDDKEYQALLTELRVTAEKVLREDEWKYAPSEDILGFS